MASLYELTGDFLTLYEMAEDPETDEQAFFDTMEGIECAIEMKADGYAKMIRNMESTADAIDSEVKRLQARKNAIANAQQRLKDSLFKAMKDTGKTKFKTDLFSFGIQKNPARVVLHTDDVKSIPEEYLKQQLPKVNTQAIKDAIKNGIDISFAHLEQGESLRLR